MRPIRAGHTSDGTVTRRRIAPGAQSQDRVVATCIIWSYAAINTLLAGIRFLLWPRRRPSVARSVCVYRIGNVGDTICALPSLWAVRQAYPDAHLVLLTSPGERGQTGADAVFAGINWIDEILKYHPREIQSIRESAAFLKTVRRYHFDVFIELTNDVARLRVVLRNMIFARLTGAKWAGGWSINLLRVALRRQSETIDFPNEVARLVEDVERCGITARNLTFRLSVIPEAEKNVDELLKAHGIPDHVPLLAIAHGSKRPVSKWPADRFAEVASELVAQGYHLVLLGAPSEWQEAEEICQKVGRRCQNLAGSTDMPTLAALLRRCRVLICNDSGPQHVASAVGTPCVAITSYSNLRGKWRAHHPDSIILQKMVPCHTCFQTQCPNDHLCLTEIPAQEAVRATLGIMQVSTEAAASQK